MDAENLFPDGANFEPPSRATQTSWAANVEDGTADSEDADGKATDDEDDGSPALPKISSSDSSLLKVINL